MIVLRSSFCICHVQVSSSDRKYYYCHFISIIILLFNLKNYIVFTSITTEIKDIDYNTQFISNFSSFIKFRPLFFKFVRYLLHLFLGLPLFQSTSRCSALYLSRNSAFFVFSITLLWRRTARHINTQSSRERKL